MISKIKNKIKQNPDLIKIGLTAVLNRIIVLCLGFLIIATISPAKNFFDNFYKAWIQWDAGWYLTIARDGYDKKFPSLPEYSEFCVNNSTECQRNFAFFPAYPTSVKVVSAVTTIDPRFIGIILSNIYFVIATVFLYRLVKQKYSEKIARTTVLLLMFFPLSYIFSGMMTESLFLMLLVMTYYFAENKRWIPAGIVGALLSATRIVGFLGIGIIILKYLEHKNFKIKLKEIDPRFVFALIIFPLGILGFMTFLKIHTGSFFSYFIIQKYWTRSIIVLNPITLLSIITDYQRDGSIITHIYNLIWLGFITFTFVYGLVKKILKPSLLFIIAWIIVPILAGATIAALPRYISVLFPIYIVIAHIIEKLEKPGRIIIPLSFLALGVMIYFYVNGTGLTI